MRKRTFLGVVGALAAVALSLAACSAGGRTSSAGAGSAAAASKSIDGMPKLTIAMVTHAAPGDPFFNVIKKGAQDAAAKDNVKFLYASNPDGSQQAQLVQNYINQKVDGLIVTLAYPGAMKSEVQKAEAAGIPVVVINSGITQAAAFGAIASFGAVDEEAGQLVGEQLAKDGYQHPLCINQQQGAVELEQRCTGIKSKVPGTQELYVNGASQTDVSSKLTAKLQQDPSIDAVVGLGYPESLIAVDVVAQTHSKAKIASFDMNPALLTDIANGKVLFTVDQQPYLQGYESVDAEWLYRLGKLALGGGQATLTGPTLVTKSDAAQVKAYSAKNLR